MSSSIPPITVEAEDIADPERWGPTEGGWGLWDNGSINTRVELPQTGIYQLDIIARGDYTGKYPPNLAVVINGETVAHLSVTSDEWSTYSVDLSDRVLSQGKHKVHLYFTNSIYDKESGLNSNLFIDRFSFSFLQEAEPPELPQSQETTSSLRELAAQRDFYVGTAVNDRAFNEDPKYREILASEFNLITGENIFKPHRLSLGPRDYNFGPADELAEFADQNHMNLRGHTLIWSLSVPEWLREADYSRKQLIRWMRRYIHKVVKRYKGQVDYWDVVNEAVDRSGKLAENFWLEKIGPEYIDLAFRFAHEADPDAKLFYNDFRSTELNEKSDGIFQLLKGLQERGVPIHGVGLQTHRRWALPLNRESAEANMRRFGDLGLEVQITELKAGIGIPTYPHKLTMQAQVYGDATASCLAVDSCTAVTVWNFSDNYWYPTREDYGKGAIFDEEYRKKSGYFEMQEALEAMDGDQED